MIRNTLNVCGHLLRFSFRRLTFSSRLGEFGGWLCNSRVVQVQQQPLQCGTGGLWNKNGRRLNWNDGGGGGETTDGRSLRLQPMETQKKQRVGPFLAVMSEPSMRLTPVHATTKTGSSPTTCEDNFTCWLVYFPRLKTKFFLKKNEYFSFNSELSKISWRNGQQAHHLTCFESARLLLG